MENRLHSKFPQHRTYEVSIAQIAGDHWPPAYGPVRPDAEIIQDYRHETFRRKSFGSVASNITGSSCYQNARLHPSYPFSAAVLPVSVLPVPSRATSCDYETCQMN